MRSSKVGVFGMPNRLNLSPKSMIMIYSLSLFPWFKLVHELGGSILCPVIIQ